MMLFSQRMRLTKRAEEWCKTHNIPVTPLNIVTAIDAIANIEMPAQLESMEKGLQEILTWSRAYSLTAFPEPDFKRAEVVLAAHGLSLSQISASNMRHVIKGVEEIAERSLTVPIILTRKAMDGCECESCREIRKNSPESHRNKNSST